MADNNPKKPIPPASTQRTTMIMVIILLAVAFFVGSQFMRTGAMGTTVTDQLITSEFTQAVEQGRVKSVTYSAGDYTVSGTYFPAATAGSEAAGAFNGAFDSLNALMATEHGEDGKALGGVATTTLDPATLGKEHNYTSTYVGSDSLGELLAAHPDISYQVTLPSPFLEVLATLLPILIIGGLLMFFFYKMQQANNSQMSFGKNKAKKTLEERPDVTFADVAGVDEAVEEMQEIKDFLANPAKYQSMGAKIPRGCLLMGPPGTGKPLLARAVAGEAGVPFFSISGSDFVEMFVGVGASRVRDLFKDAKEASPAIIFIDEIDAVGRQRGTGLGGGHDEREQTLNQLLVEMDGFESNDSVVLIAATNRADVLDPALLRPGRFDRQIVVDTPDVKGRQRILEVHSKDKPIGSDVDLAKIAKITPGFTGADLANLMNESALLTARRGKKIITMREVSESMERVIAGPERKGRVMNEKTKHTIAYHESGHALVGHLLDHADPVHKISIISRGRALGYTLSIPDEDKVLNSLSEMKDELAVFMGGRVAEEIFCDDITTGASNDLERASKMARAIVTRPKVLLLDEPLSAIDAKLRKSLQVEIRRIQKQLNITTIFVTHDQDEAMVMSDRICLLNCGKIEQMDTPIAIYTHPRTKFAAGFIGSYNVLEPLEFGRVTGDIDLPAQPIAIRPEVLNIAREKQNLPGTYDIEGTVIDSTPRGNVLRYKVDVNGVQLSADTLFRSFSIYENGSKVWLSLEKRNCLHVEEEAV